MQYMGPPGVPHVNEEFFTSYFFGAHVSLPLFLSQPPEAWPRAWWLQRQATRLPPNHLQARRFTPVCFPPAAGGGDLQLPREDPGQ
jgi:hypothetical protein